MKRVLVVVPNRATFVTAWAIEYAITLSKRGHSVDLIDLAPYEYRYLRNPMYWQLDEILEKNSIRKNMPRICVENDVNLIEPNLELETEYALSADELNFFHKALRSTVANHFGTSKVKIEDVDKEFYDLQIESFSRSLAVITSLIKEGKYELISTVNGRGIIDGSAVLASQNMRCEYELIEMTSENWSYFSFQRLNTQSVQEIQKKILERKASCAAEPNISSVDDYFISRINDSGNNEDIPRSLLHTPFVTFYPTSDYEFATFGPGNTFSGDFQTQEEAFISLARLARNLDLKLVVRVHPHPPTSPLHVFENSHWRELCKKENAICIESQEKISSFKLASRAVINVTHGSTIGAEILYLGFPVALTQSSTYSMLTPGCEGFRESSLAKLLLAPYKLPHKMKLFAWVDYMTHGEHELVYFQMRAPDEVLFEGNLLNVRRLFLYKFIRALARLKKRRLKLFLSEQ